MQRWIFAGLLAVAGCAGPADVRTKAPRFTAVAPANFADLAACMADQEVLSARGFQVTPIVYQGQGRAHVTAGRMAGWAGYLGEYDIEITRQPDGMSRVVFRLRDAPFEREKRTEQVQAALTACAPGWTPVNGPSAS